MMPHSPSSPRRIATLDFVRGVAVLGILLLNITAFGLPKAAYLNPAYAGYPALHEALTWAVMDLLAQAKFLTLFALLFGAGLQLLLPRGTRWVHARLFWLMLIGLLHGIFMWDGDILLDYGLIGLLCYAMIRQADSSRMLMRIGVVMYAVGVGMLVVLSQILSPEPGRYWLPSDADIAYEAYWLQLGGVEAWRNRIDLLIESLLSLGVQYGWLLAGSLLLGAGLMRSGWLRGEFSGAHYRKVALWFIAMGLLIDAVGMVLQWHLAWEYRWSGLLLQIPRDIAAPIQAIGYLALCYGYWSTLRQWRVSAWIGDIGRMALSSYLLQTLICTQLFYHWGGFMQFDRLQLLGIVPFIWLINGLAAHYWLRHFEQGPLEWGWRRLTRLIAGPSR
ncbi:DUF418 domain-containing protein YeiB [Candidatus Symbiopectobacterium sp. NZEC151]|uniref:DUF418 domain-containing protein YeiB n=1 Tax=Candidatus Symbiopectobacterium sp. NZEC151 TaxID=2820470 RepID=UPI002227B8AA|nr:DUF418 domain-containing protein YeiB [Candidatus Symbiopectobacterium sp. NZEC151]MCW2473468.1 DUF418 family protein [Candidatus Symbiopectobacterium sp. NZEC151]